MLPSIKVLNRGFVCKCKNFSCAKTKEAENLLKSNCLFFVTLLPEQHTMKNLNVSHLIGETPGSRDVSERMIKKHLQVLKEFGIILRIGTKRKGHWEIIKQKSKEIHQ